LLDIQKLQDFIPKTVSEFYNTLCSLDSVPKSESQELMHELFDLKNEKTKALFVLKKESQKVKYKFFIYFCQLNTK
jgi:hypothetical protein